MDSKPVYLTTNAPRTAVEDVNIHHRCDDVTVEARGSSPMSLFRGVAEVALYCAHRTTTALSWGLCEQERRFKGSDPFNLPGTHTPFTIALSTPSALSSSQGGAPLSVRGTDRLFSARSCEGSARARTADRLQLPRVRSVHRSSASPRRATRGNRPARPEGA